MAKTPKDPGEDGTPPSEEVIFRRYRYDPRSGKWLDARHYGFRAWPIHVRR